MREYGTYDTNRYIYFKLSSRCAVNSANEQGERAKGVVMAYENQII